MWAEKENENYKKILIMWRENDPFVNQNLAGGEVYTGKGGSEGECIDFFLIKENDQIFWLMGDSPYPSAGKTLLIMLSA